VVKAGKKKEQQSGLEPDSHQSRWLDYRRDNGSHQEGQAVGTVRKTSQVQRLDEPILPRDRHHAKKSLVVAERIIERAGVLIKLLVQLTAIQPKKITSGEQSHVRLNVVHRRLDQNGFVGQPEIEADV